jgi:hypothetical protein
MSRRKALSEVIKRQLRAREQCENSPQNPGIGCEGYLCPMWIYNNGHFDASGKEIDHKLERACGGTDQLNNLQVLCPCCHSYKTRKYLSNRGIATEWYDFGVRHMDIDGVKCKTVAKKSTFKEIKMKNESVTKRKIAITIYKPQTISPKDVEMPDVSISPPPLSKKSKK